MTSRSSKNRQITRASTLKWNRLRAVALGAILLNFAPVASAQESPPGRRSVQDAGASRPAVERWRRLKSKYEATPVPVTSAPVAPTQVEQPIRSGEATVSPVVRPIPDDASEFQPRTASINGQPVEASSEVPVATVPNPEVELPAPVAVEQVTPEFIGVSQQPVAVQEKPKGTVADSGDRATPPPTYEEKVTVQSPVEGEGTLRGPRPAFGTVPRTGPLRTATQLRRISDIAPRMDQIQDSDINDFAAEQALELKVKFGGEQYTERSYPDMVMPWAAPESKYFPLYFQDPALERYGHSHSHILQPVVSSARFTTQLVLLPYQMAITPPWEMQSPLGWYRPGDVVPKLRYPFPWNTKAAVVEAATVTGIIFAIP